MKSFEHTNAGTVADALQLFEQYGDKARFIAGGTDLLGLLKTDVLPTYPKLLINIKTITGLGGIEKNERGLKIGALARLSDLAESAEIKKNYPVLAEAAASVGMQQIRNMGTLGGNLAQDTRCWYYRYPDEIGGHIPCARKGNGKCLAVAGDNRYHAVFGGKKCFAVCPSDTAVALAALDARLQIQGPQGQRTLNVMDFYHPLGKNLNPGEIITKIHIPEPVDNRQVFMKHRVRGAIDFAIVSTAVVCTLTKQTCSAVRIVLGAVAPGPYRATQAEEVLLGKTLDDKIIDDAAKAAVAEAVPLSQNAYKIPLASALVKRALHTFIPKES